MFTWIFNFTGLPIFRKRRHERHKEGTANKEHVTGQSMAHFVHTLVLLAKEQGECDKFLFIHLIEPKFLETLAGSILTGVHQAGRGILTRPLKIKLILLRLVTVNTN